MLERPFFWVICVQYLPDISGGKISINRILGFVNTLFMVLEFYLSRSESMPKTEFALRLRSVRKILGDEERGRFAAKVGLPKNTLANYELGLNEPPISVLVKYQELFGVDIRWLATGTGEMFSSEASNNIGTALLDRDIMKIAIEAVEEGLAGRVFPANKKAELILNGYDLILKDRTNRNNVVIFARAS